MTNPDVILVPPGTRRRLELRPLLNTPVTVPVLIVVVAVIAANVLYLAGIFDANPMLQYSNLGVHSQSGLLPGQNNIDPNQGFVSQALGHLAARDWLHGQIPWWNPFEGVGMPLAGEMQSAALFPLVIVDIFANGQLYFRIILEITAGLSMLFLLRRLVRSPWAATAGAVAFALNGTFAWMFHAPGNPVAFAPMLLLGIEQARQPRQARGLTGWPLIAIAIALSIYAGFPEVAFIDGLLAIVWAAIRASETPRDELAAYLRRLAAGAATGLLLAAPLLIAFLTFTQSADLLDHGGSGFANAYMLPSATLPALVMPYIYGPVFSWLSYDHTGVNLIDFWGNIGGYLGSSLTVLGFAGLVGRRERRLRIALAVWLFLAVGRTVGLPGVMQLVNAVPGIKQTAFFRYSAPSWSLALIVLAALAIDDLAHRREPRRLIGAGLVALAVIAVLAGQSGYLHRVISAAPGNRWAQYLSIAFAVLVIGGCVAVGVLIRRSQLRALILGSIVACEALALFVMPELSAPRGASIDYGPVRFLQQHLGDHRFFTLGPIAPNYGSYFQLASININDEPIVGSWSKYIPAHLNDNAQPAVFTGTVPADPSRPDPEHEFETHFAAYEAVGVKYVVIPGGSAPPVIDGHPLPMVYSSPVADILELPHPAPFQSVTGGGCTLVASSPDQAVAQCTSAGWLIRREQYMPGWSATDGGQAKSVSVYGSIFQQVNLHPGRNVVAFSFVPPHVHLAEAGAAAGVVIIVVGVLARAGVGPSFNRRRRNRRAYQPAHRRSKGPGPADGSVSSRSGSVR